MNNSLVFPMLYLTEAYSNDTLSIDKCVAIADTILFTNDNVFEGANNDIMKTFSKGQKKFKDIVKKLKPLVKKGDPKDAKTVETLVNEGIECMDETYKAIQEISSTPASTVLSFFIIHIIDFIKWFIPILLTWGLAAIIPGLQQSLNIYESCVKYIRDGESGVDAFNQVRVRYSHDTRALKASLKKYLVMYNKNVEKNKENNKD